MQLTLQEIADAAIRDLEAKSARSRRAGRPIRSVKRVPATAPVRIALPIPVPTLSREIPPHRTRPPVDALAPTRRYLTFFIAGVVVLAVGCLGLAWAYASAGWQQEARAQRRELILQQGMALRAEIDALASQAARLDEKARSLLQYSTDLRYSFYGNAGAREIEQADAVLADRDRLLREIARRRHQISNLRQESASLYAQP